jgi:hypothetical protein
MSDETLEQQQTQSSDVQQTAPQEPAAEQAIFTPEQQQVVDRIVRERLRRQEETIRKRLEEQIRQELAEEQRKQEMSEIERLQYELQQRDQRLRELHMKLVDKTVSAEARIQAIAAGVKPERADYVVRLLPLDQIRVDEDGNIDSEALSSAINQLLTEFPELRQQTTPTRLGAEVPYVPPTDSTLNDEIIAKMSPEELRRRMPEIEAYYRTKRRQER